MPEIEVELQIVVFGLIAKSCRIGKECIGINSARRVGALVAAVEGDAATNIRMPSAVGFVGLYYSPTSVQFIKSLH